MTPSSRDIASGEEFVKDLKDRIQQVTADVESAIDENRYPAFMTVLYLTDAFLNRGIATLSLALRSRLTRS